MKPANLQPYDPWRSFPVQQLDPIRHAQVRAAVVAEAGGAGHRSYRPPRAWIMAPVAAGSVGAVIVAAGIATGAWSGSPTSTSSRVSAASTSRSQSAGSTGHPSQQVAQAQGEPRITEGKDQIAKARAADARASALARAHHVAFLIPDRVAYTRAQLPADQTNELDLGQYANTLAVSGQVCDHPGAQGRRPIAGRWWSWWAGAGDAGVQTVDLVVTGWKPGTGRANFADVVDDSGYCIWFHPVTTKPGVTVEGAEQTYAAVSSYLGLHVAYVVVREGDLLGAVSVQDLHSTAAALVTAERLAAITAEDLAKMGVPAPA